MADAMTSFQRAVRRVVMRIPKGSVLSYGEVAERAGFSGAARAVGSFLKRNDNPCIPCHRVIRADGHLGEYNRGGPKRKADVLLREGVRIRNGRLMRNQ